MDKSEGKHEKKSRFIELRAKGNSLARCAREIGVSKTTACNWTHELERAIAQAKAVELEALMEQFAMFKEARIAFLAGQLGTIREELESRGLSDVPTTKLLEAQLTYFKELMAEAIETKTPREIESGTKSVTKLNAAAIASSVQDVYERRRAGELSAKDAKEELVMLEALRKIHEQAVLEDKYEHLRSLLEDRR